MANEYLKRQPTSSGNSRRWTISFWMKNSDPTQGYTAIMGAGKVSPNNVYNEIFYNGSQTGLNLDNASASDNYNITANPLLRDPSAWMHVVVSFTDQGDNANTRIKFYINGAFVDHNTGTALDVSETSFFNDKDYIHYIGSRAQQSYGGTTFDAQYFDVFLVDGQALTPDVFGFYKDGKGYQSSGSSDSTDFGPGQWSPHTPRKIKSDIERRGGFGVNGFYLPMNDSSNFGADFHCAPNSIIKLKGEDLPQPRNGAPTTSDSYVSQLRQEQGTLGFDGAVAFDGDGDYLSIADHPDLEFGSGDFTIECFLYPTGIPQGTYGAIFTKGYPLQSYFMSTNSISLYASTATSGSYNIVQNSNATGTNSVPLGRWTHYALCRSGNTWKIFINGNELYSATHSGTIADSTQPFGIGDYSQTPGTYEFQGFISNFRVVKGTALYTSNFTAPTEPLTNVTNTKLLCCNSSTSATAATVSPGTITANGNASATRNELTGSMVLAVPGISTARIPSDTELVTNGTFDSNANGWSVTSGSSSTLTYDSTNQNIDIVRNSEQCIETDSTITIESGKFYKLSWELVSTSDGNNGYVYLQMTGTTLNTPTTSDYRGTGKYESIFYASSTTSAKLRVQAGGVPGLQFTLDNISIKEVSNLIANGHFDTNTTGWTATNCTTAWENGQLKITRTAGGGLTANQVFTTVSGKRYTITGTINSSGSRGDLRVYDGSGISGSMIVSLSGTNGSVTDLKGSFTASSTTSTVVITIDVNGTVVYADNIVVKQEDAPRDYSADIKGSGSNKTLTPTGYSGVGYELGGYYGSALNFPGGSTSSLATPSNSDFAFGTGDFTVEFWVKASTQHSYHQIFDTRGTIGNSTTGFSIGYTSGNFYIYSNSFNIQRSVSLGQFVHIAAEREGSNLTLYINGVAIGVQNNFNLNLTNSIIYIGATGSGDTSQYFKGQVQDLRVYKGVAKYKGGFDVPKPYTPVGIESWRQVSDTCKNNFCTLNPLDTNQLVPTNGNLSIDQSSGGWHSSLGTHYVRSGKWYAEMRIDRLGWIFFGVEQTWLETRTRHIGGQTGSKGVGLVYNTGNRGDITYNGTNSAYTGGDATAANGDIISIALDLDGNNVKFYKNNILQYDLSNILESGADYAFGVSPYSNVAATVNFGQNPTFSGQVTAGTYTDSNGKGLFKYQPPAGYLALCEDNLPTPAIADPSKHFQTLLWEGQGSPGKKVTGLKFKPDLVWIKNRATGVSNSWHSLSDSVRNARMFPNETSAEDSFKDVMSFDDNGFSLNYGTYVNYGGGTYVGWCWKAGGAAVSNTDGTITSQVSANQTAGFSIASYTGDGNAGATFGHGLGKSPDFIIVKRRDSTSHWNVWHSALTNNQALYLNLTNSVQSFTTFWNDTTPTSSVITLGTDRNTLNGTYIAYCWTEIEGYSKFGNYIGSGGTDGPFVYCGFKPAFVMTKRTDTTGEWWMYDSSRGPTNPIPRMLLANSSGTENEDSASYMLDFVSNGFKWRAGLAAANGDGGSFIFMAFAESPFQTANAK